MLRQIRAAVSSQFEQLSQETLNKRVLRRIIICDETSERWTGAFKRLMGILPGPSITKIRSAETLKIMRRLIVLYLFCASTVFCQSNRGELRLKVVDPSGLG